MESKVGPSAGGLHGFHPHAEFRLGLFCQALLEVILPALIARERFRHPGSDGSGVEIPDQGEDHLIGDVTLLVKHPEGRERGVLDHVFQADRVPLVRVVAEHDPLDLIVDLVVGAVLTLIVLFHHDLPLAGHFGQR